MAETDDDRNPIARCPECGRLLAIQSSSLRISHPEDYYKTLAEWAREGFQISEMSSDEFRGGRVSDWGHKNDCSRSTKRKRKARQPKSTPLFTEPA